MATGRKLAYKIKMEDKALITIPNTTQKPFFITALTSGQVMVWDKDDNQIPEWQIAFKAGEDNHELLQLLANQCEEFSIGLWGSWRQSLSKEEFFGLLHLSITDDLNSAAK